MLSQPCLPSQESGVPGLPSFGGPFLFMPTPFSAEQRNSAWLHMARGMFFGGQPLHLHTCVALFVSDSRVSCWKRLNVNVKYCNYILTLQIFIFNLLNQVGWIATDQHCTFSPIIAAYPGEPGLTGFIGAKDDGSSGDNWRCETCKPPVKSSLRTNQRPTFYRPHALPVAQPTV